MVAWTVLYSPQRFIKKFWSLCLFSEFWVNVKRYVALLFIYSYLYCVRGGVYIHFIDLEYCLYYILIKKPKITILDFNRISCTTSTCVGKWMKEGTTTVLQDPLVLARRALMPWQPTTWVSLLHTRVLMRMALLPLHTQVSFFVFFLVSRNVYCVMELFSVYVWYEIE